MSEHDDDLPVPARSDRDVVRRLAEAVRQLAPPARPDDAASPAPDAGQQLQGAATGPAGSSSPTAASREVPPGAAPRPEFDYVEVLTGLAWRLDRVAHAAIREGSWTLMDWPDWLPPLLRGQIRAAWSIHSPVAWAEHALGARLMRAQAGPWVQLDPVIATGRPVRVLSSSRDGPTRLIAAGRFVSIDGRTAAVVVLWPTVRTGDVIHVLPPVPDDVRAGQVTSREPVSMAEARLRDRRLVVDAPVTLFRPGDRVVVAGRAGRPVRGEVESMTLLVGAGESWTVTVWVNRRRIRRCVTAVRHDLALPPDALKALGPALGGSRVAAEDAP